MHCPGRIWLSLARILTATFSVAGKRAMEKVGGEEKDEGGIGWGKAGSPHLGVSSTQNRADTTYNSTTVWYMVKRLREKSRIKRVWKSEMSSGRESKRYRKLPVGLSGSSVRSKVHAFHTVANTPLQ